MPVGARIAIRVALWSGIISILIVLSAPADARHRHHHHHRVKSSYSPPYAAIVVDANSGVTLHEANADSQRHPASLTKIMTLYLLFEQLEAARLRLDTPLQVSEHAASMAPSKLGLMPGQTIEVDAAIRAVVTKSANDVAVVIAEAIAGDENKFGRLMTNKARALGMSRTIYRNASGLPDDEQITTARDQALLGRAIQDRFPRYYRYFATPSFAYRGRAMRNHNKLLGRVAGVDGIKTGYIQASGFNLVTSVRRGNRHLVAVVLGGRSAGTRDARMRELIEQHIAKASAQQTAPIIVEARTTAPAALKPAPASVPAAATAAAPTATRLPAETTTAIAEARVAIGSTDEIRPIPVKTVRVRANMLKVGSIGIAAAEAAPAPTLADRQQENAQVEPSKPIQVASAQADPVTTHSAAGDWMIQVGALATLNEAKQRLAAAQIKAAAILAGATSVTEKVTKRDQTLYRARFAGLDKGKAEAACRQLKRGGVPCLLVRN